MLLQKLEWSSMDMSSAYQEPTGRFFLADWVSPIPSHRRVLTFGISSVICCPCCQYTFRHPIGDKETTYRDRIQPSKRVQRINQPGNEANHIIIPPGIVNPRLKNKFLVVMRRCRRSGSHHEHEPCCLEVDHWPQSAKHTTTAQTTYKKTY